MPRPITRRDFLNGAALTIAATVTPLDQLMAQGAGTGVYPPALLGLRGSTDAAFRTIHALALEGERFDAALVKPDESYDLIVIGAGLAGLTAAWAFAERRRGARILILDNNDDFGGHARRTEHTLAGRTVIGYGGSESMVAPAVKFKGELDRILRTLRIDTKRFEDESVFHRRLYPGLRLSKGVFFDRETFGIDKLVTGDPMVLGFDEFAPANPGGRPFREFIADCPLSEPARRGLIELFEGTRDYMAGQSAEEKVARLQKLTYGRFLAKVCGLPRDAVAFFQGRPCDNWGFGIDALGAIELLGDGYPGAKALGIEEHTAGDPADKAAYIYHFPDGNATIARALVRAMIPGVVRSALPRTSIEHLVTARFDYGRLDRPVNRVRLRLEATAVSVRNLAAGRVDVAYVHRGRLRRVEAAQAVVATYMSAMPYICKEIDAERGAAMRENVKTPLLYTKVAVANWRAFERLGVHKILAPNCYHSTVKLDYPVSFGSYRYDSDPARPTVLHLVHTPNNIGPGMDMREQARAERASLLTTTFADLEKRVRGDLDRMLRPGGFDAARDITAITVNRWAHGYSYTPMSVFDDLDMKEKRQQSLRQRIGAIAFANSDTAWDAYAHAAMAEGVRAIDELTGTPPPPYRARWSERLTNFLRRKGEPAPPKN